MSKAKTILSAAMVMAGALGGPLATMATTEPVQLHENIEDGIFRVMRLDPYAGMMRLYLTIPEGQVIKRVVTARPGDDRYRLMPELDAAALKMLDGDAEGLILKEFENPGIMVLGQTFDNWAGFSVYDYMDTGLRFFDLNPADVIYVGIVLEDVNTGEETRYYHKVDYRSCAHEQVIKTGEIIMCEVEHEAGRTVYVPEASKLTAEAPTWEEELAALAKEAVKEDFDELETLEAVQAEGGKIEAKQVEALEARGKAMDFAKFPEMAEIEAIKTDYSVRVAALRQAVTTESEQKPQEPQKPQESQRPSVPSASGAADVSGASSGSNERELVKSVQVQDNSTPVKRVNSEVDSRSSSAEGSEEVAQVEVPESSAERAEESEDVMAIPKLGGSWLERYWLALVVAGASLTGVVGWFLIGALAKKRKHNER